MSNPHKRNTDRDHGATIGGALVLAVIFGAFATLARAESPAASFRSHPAPIITQAATIEFVILQNQSVQTVTCKDGVLLADYSGWGHVSGNQCTSTGPLSSATGIYGTFVVDLVGVHIEGCRLDTVSLAGGIAQYAINCTH